MRSFLAGARPTRVTAIGVLIGLLSSIVVGVGGFGSAAVAADEDDGLEFAAKTTFRLQPEDERIRVTVDVTVTNQKPNSGAYYYYFDSIHVPAPTDATDIVAVSSGGSVLTTRTEDGSEDWQQIIIDLPSRLLYGETADLQIAYDLPNLPPRSDGWTRANPAYASFPVFAVGDSGLADVTVLIPDDYEVHTSGAQLHESTDAGLLVLTETEIAEPLDWWAVVGAQNDDRLEQRDVEAGETSVKLRYWPGDEEWADFVEDQLATGLPALEAVIGAPFPVDGELQIIESGTPHLFGWGGWYDSADDVIEIGDELDETLVFHELTHAWFNSRTANDLWLIEGLAETVAHHALEHRDGEGEAPEAVSLDDDGAQPLLAWSATGLATSGEPTPEDDYGYDAAWWVLTELANEVGQERFTEVTSAAVRGVMPYQGDEEVLTDDTSFGWRRTLDLFEEVGNSSSVTELFDQWVLQEQDQYVIDERRAARETYAGLDEGPDGWSPPLEIRADMTNWRFSDISDLAETAHGVLAERDFTLEVLTPFDVDALSEFEDAYETSDDVSDVAALGDEYEGVAGTIEEAMDEPGIVVDTLSNVGLLGYDVDQTLESAASELEDGNIDAARTHADEALNHVEDAPLTGAIRYGMFAALAFGVSLAWWGRQRRHHVITTAGPVGSARNWKTPRPR